MLVQSQTEEKNAIFLWRSPQVYAQALQDYATRLLAVPPSVINDKDLFDLEGLLNTLYIQACIDGWPNDLAAMILDVLAQASALSDLVRRLPAGSSRDAEFFKKIKSLSHLSQLLVIYIQKVSHTLRTREAAGSIPQ